MRSLRHSTRLAGHLSGLLAMLIIAASSAARADAPRSTAEGKRIPWTTSRISGTPDAPLPYTAEPAFPALTFDRPVLLTQAPGSHDLVVAEVGGKVLSFPDDPAAGQAEVALDLASAGRGFGALYGLAFHPRFEENRQVFVCYTRPSDKAEGTRVARFTASRVYPLRIDPASEEVVLTYPEGGHNGGCLAFGPDGFLYISTGDSAAPTPPDPLETGQDIGDLLSSILRIDVDRRDPGRACRIPPDNPFVHLPGARPEIWAYGLRNPWRMSFDRATGDLWVGDVGWEQWELIFRVERGGNYGWSAREGRQTVRPEGRRGPTPILPPTADHPHSEAASITGGYVYRGRRLKELVGTYVYGDFHSGTVWGLKHDGRQVTWRGVLAHTGLRLASFGETGAGELFLVDHGGTNQVYRLSPNRAAGAHHDFPRTLSRTGLFVSTRDQTPAPGVIPYRINAEAWADGARAERFLAIPGEGRIDLNPNGTWKFPEGSVLAKTVSVDVARAGGDGPQRLETQVLHREGGGWRPYTYRWADDRSDATLVDAGGASRSLSMPGGETLAYRFAARSECGLCHNPWVEARTTVFGIQSASPLAAGAAQLDREGPESQGGENQLHRLERLGYFVRPLPADREPPLADPYDKRADLNARARAYLDVNCAHCHLYGAGGSADIALGAWLTLDSTKTVGARPLQGTFGIDDARIVAPGEPERSVLYYRIAKTGAGRMPRIGSQRIDATATRLIADWIANLPGAPVEARGRPGALPSAVDPSAQAEAIRRGTGTTREALRLVWSIDREEVPPAILRAIVDRTKNDPRTEIRDLFERFVPAADRVERLGEAIEPGVILGRKGDPARGRDWFFAESATQCKSCHRIRGVGVELGPDLDAIGAKYDKPELLRHILEPSRSIEPRYALQTIATADGQVHEGLLVEETPSRLTLRDARNRTISIATAEVEQRATRPASPMPEGLLRDLSAQQAADLLEYLSSLKGR